MDGALTILILWLVRLVIPVVVIILAGSLLNHDKGYKS